MVKLATRTHLDMEVPGVVLVMGDPDPVVEGDDALVQGQDRLVARPNPTNLHK